jgi:integral membrane protein
MNLSSPRFLCILGNVEGVSYLLLLGLAMPLKYIWGYPMAVKIVGMAHGVLFLAYCLYLIPCIQAHRWSLKFSFALFLATLIPFGTFVTDRKIRALKNLVN